jgi:hypothetical protein
MKSVFISRIQFLVFILLFTLFISCDNNEDFDVVVEVEAIEENKYSIKVQNTGSRIAYLTQCTSSSYVKTVQIKIDNNWEQSGYGGPCLDVYAISSVYLYVGQSLIAVKNIWELQDGNILMNLKIENALTSASTRTPKRVACVIYLASLGAGYAPTVRRMSFFLF